MKASDLYTETPLIYSDPISSALGCDVYLKMEAQQPSGSFKNRGIGNYCARCVEEGAKRFVSSSGGNAGLAAAFAARKLGVSITVVVPESTPAMMLKKIEDQGATVLQQGADWQEADLLARCLCETERTCYVPPFDHPHIWEGNATLIHEVARKKVKPDAVVVAVGGGGLLSGVIEGMRAVGWTDTPVFAVETAGAASLAAAMAADQVVEIEKIDTVAKSLGARAVCQRAYEWTKEHPVTSKVVTDAAAVAASEQFGEEHRILVEPACGAALSLCYDKDEELRHYRTVLVVVCGGACVTR